MANELPDLIRKGLTVLFIGINPGMKSGKTGHHFAGPSNRFWKFLKDSGLTPVKLNPGDDHRLLDFNFGITNIVSRVTATAAEITPGELREGAEHLRSLLREFKPEIAVYLGKVVYRYFSGRSEFHWGVQPVSVIPEIVDVVIPNPSGLNRIPIPEQLEYYRMLKEIIDKTHSS